MVSKQLSDNARFTICHLLVLLFLAMGPSPARAASLDLALKDPGPDIFTQFISLSYLDRTFKATGNPFDYFDGSNDFLIDNGAFELTGSLDSSGIITGDLVVRGSLPCTPGTGTLLTGTLTYLGYGATGGVLEFLFLTTGGDLAGAYGPLGGIILGDSGFVDLDTPLQPQVAMASADIGTPDRNEPAPVPEPASAVLLLAGAAGLALAQRPSSAASR